MMAIRENQSAPDLSGGETIESMTLRGDVITYCLKLKEVYEDYPFHDPNWCVIRHKKAGRCLHGFLIRMVMFGLI